MATHRQLFHCEELISDKLELSSFPTRSDAARRYAGSPGNRKDSVQGGLDAKEP